MEGCVQILAPRALSPSSGSLPRSSACPQVPRDFWQLALRLSEAVSCVGGEAARVLQPYLMRDKELLPEP